MSPAERQRRRRERLRKEQNKATTALKRTRAKDKAHQAYIPMPPGITSWKEHRVTTAEGEKVIWSPQSRPLAACHHDITDDDVLALLVQLHAMAKKRGLDGKLVELGLKAKQDKPE